MRSSPLMLVLLFSAAIAQAREPRAYQSGELLRMDSVQCSADKSALASAESAGASEQTKTMCMEYVLQAEQVIYRIRPKGSKHSATLPLGERAQFRMQKNNMLLWVRGFDSKERAYIVVSMAPRGDRTADANPVRLNHLQ